MKHNVTLLPISICLQINVWSSITKNHIVQAWLGSKSGHAGANAAITNGFLEIRNRNLLCVHDARARIGTDAGGVVV